MDTIAANRRKEQMITDDSAFDRLREDEELEASNEILADIGDFSDGYHTFNGLYDHRCALFVALMVSCPAISWRSRLHADGTGWGGWCVGGMDLPTGTITYHLPDSDWHLLDDSGVRTLERAPEWGGHTSADVVTRIKEWVRGPDLPDVTKMSTAELERLCE